VQEDSSESDGSLTLDESISKESFSSSKELQQRPDAYDYVPVLFPKGLFYVPKQFLEGMSKVILRCSI
jgi:hypothetical protein